MQEDRAGAMWLGTFGGGLKRIVNDEVTTFTTRDGLADNSVSAMTMDAAGALWVGTWDGLTRYADGRFTTFTAKDGLPDDEINALFPDTDGSLWVASEQGGMSRVKNGRVTRIEPARPLFDDGALGILEPTIAAISGARRIAASTGCLDRSCTMWPTDAARRSRSCDTTPPMA